MSFMTIEGDRSGVTIPTRQEKANEKIHAMIKQLNEKTDYSVADIDAAMESLSVARFLLLSEQ